MAEFAKYYVEFLWALVKNLWDFVKSIALAFYNLFVGDAIDYVKDLSQVVGNFDVFGWICLIFASILHIVLVFFIVYRIIQLIRRYFIFRSTEIEKDKLLEEIARLREQSERLIKEKNQIFSLKVGAKPADDFPSEETAVTGAAGATGETSAPVKSGESRFTKLANLDEKYEEYPVSIYMTESDMLSLKDIVKRFVNFAASQMRLYYTEDTIRLFFAGLADKKNAVKEIMQEVVLCGLSRAGFFQKAAFYGGTALR
ncbi:MAG: hypothetical protein J6Z34_01455, partial [Clostridia bacterium]|nr:hypothetical protein [Clostridia bacterium]